MKTQNIDETIPNTETHKTEVERYRSEGKCGVGTRCSSVY